jgi:uncharacterized protein
MSPAALIGLLALAGAAAYAQTLTGFAFGLITMGGIALTGMMSLPDAAVVVSILTLVNASQMLVQGWRYVALREFCLVMASSIPLLFAGYAFLEWLADTRIDLLRLALAIVIMASSLQLARKPAPLSERSGAASFLFFGGIAGAMGGMFSTAGPPLVYHFYRQPIQLGQIRETLVAVFALNAIFRIGLVAGVGDLPLRSSTAGLLAIPAVMAATYAARKWPPPLSPRAMRRIVFILLFLSGVSLGAPSVAHLLRSLR